MRTESPATASFPRVSSSEQAPSTAEASSWCRRSKECCSKCLRENNEKNRLNRNGMESFKDCSKTSFITCLPRPPRWLAPAVGKKVFVLALLLVPPLWQRGITFLVCKNQITTKALWTHDRGPGKTRGGRGKMFFLARRMDYVPLRQKRTECSCKRQGARPKQTRRTCC